MPSRSSLSLFISVLVSLLPGPLGPVAQSPPDPLQVAPPAMRKIEPPSPSSSVHDLEMQGDELRASKAYLDAVDYYTAALSKEPRNATILNKRGIANLQLQRYK